jgi:hypothetical protein
VTEDDPKDSTKRESPVLLKNKVNDEVETECVAFRAETLSPTYRQRDKLSTTSLTYGAIWIASLFAWLDSHSGIKERPEPHYRRYWF